jgi:hypothetical protein
MAAVLVLLFALRPVVWADETDDYVNQIYQDQQNQDDYVNQIYQDQKNQDDYMQSLQDDQNYIDQIYKDQQDQDDYMQSLQDDQNYIDQIYKDQQDQNDYLNSIWQSTIPEDAAGEPAAAAMLPAQAPGQALPMLMNAQAIAQQAAALHQQVLAFQQMQFMRLMQAQQLQMQGLH